MRRRTTAMTEVSDMEIIIGYMQTLVYLGIRKAAQWYNAHLILAHPPVRGQPNLTLPKVVLLTDDFANCQKAVNEGIPCISGACRLPYTLFHFLTHVLKCVITWRV